MSQPRVRVYGLLSLTKRQYLVSLVLGLLLLGVLLVLWFTHGVRYVKHPWAPYLALVVVIGAALEAIEVLVVLRKFRRLEAEEQAKAAGFEARK